MGLPIGAVLREQTTSMRLVRKQKAEEKAQKVTVIDTQKPVLAVPGPIARQIAGNATSVTITDAEQLAGAMTEQLAALFESDPRKRARAMHQRRAG